MSLIPSDQIFTKKVVARGWGLSQFTITVVLGVLLLIGYQIRQAVRVEIPGLKDQIAARDETIRDLEDVTNQAVDAVVMLLDFITANGLTPPQVRIQPQDLKMPN